MRIQYGDNLQYLRGRLTSTLNKVRQGRNPEDVTAEFYIALGMIGAATTLGAITIEASSNLHDLALNASEQRSAELSAIAKAARLKARQEAAA
ncbi:hypothetical protein ACIGKM_11680 [Ectopseudomonas toyotomiensis]|uniref:hypothetical protein n=1 Tax=Ectopseudomonas toyotomiensis TaxID=554344 RepID=UPI0037C97FE5